MKKPYVRLPLDTPSPAFRNETSIWTPMLNIRVAWNHKQTPRFPTVVDSGSPYCLFKAGVAEYLGISVSKGIEDTIYGISSGMSEPAFFHRVRIYVEADWIIDVMAGFVKKLSVAGVLGRNGFFDHFKVHFDQSVVPPILEVEKIERIQ